MQLLSSKNFASVCIYIYGYVNEHPQLSKFSIYLNVFAWPQLHVVIKVELCLQIFGSFSCTHNVGWSCKGISLLTNWLKLITYVTMGNTLKFFYQGNILLCLRSYILLNWHTGERGKFPPATLHNCRREWAWQGSFDLLVFCGGAPNGIMPKSSVCHVAQRQWKQSSITVFWIEQSPWLFWPVTSR